MWRLARDGVGLAYEEAGSGAPPIVLVHDFGSDHTCFACQFDHFRSRHRVVAVDLRGHGQSEGPRGACAVDLLADDLAWLCCELGLYRPVLLGRGLGGMVALDLATRYRDIPAAIVTVTSAAGKAAGVVEVPGYEAGSRFDSISTCELAAANLGRAVPVPQVAFHVGEVLLPEVINVLVDEFLSELVDRAPP